VSEQGLSSPGTTDGNHNATHTDADLGCDFEEFEANGGTVSRGEFGVSQSVLAQGLH